MKKTLVSLVLFFSAVAAQAGHGPAGCGLGSMLFEGKEGLVMNVLAATFNGSSGNQTFAMSTGTLGCEDAKTAKVTSVAFIEGNIIALSNDIARGEGETLEAYLQLNGKENADKAVLKNNFEAIFSAGSALEIDKKINELI